MKDEWSYGHVAGISDGLEDGKICEYGDTYNDKLPKGIDEVWIAGSTDHEYAVGYKDGYSEGFGFGMQDWHSDE